MEPQTKPAPHWVDRIAARVAPISNSHIISTGISPSGEIHVGNLREVLTGELLARALRDAGKAAALHYFADDFDPLRRVYPFLDASIYEPLIGKPICSIPCPCSEHASYSEHFLEPFLRSLPRLGIHLEVLRSSELYAAGRMNRLIVQALQGRDRIAAILAEQTGKEVAPEWSPFQVVCAGCGKMTGGRVTGFSEEGKTVDYACECGSKGTVPMAGGGKLQWRVDWPARWKLLGVTVEPFGKDHASRGGSFDTGVRIIREVFEGEPPEGVPYEWINLRGRGDMSSSKGNVVAIAEVLEALPAEAMRFLIVRARPLKTISFDPGRPLLSLVDEFEALEAKGSSPRVVELCKVEGYRRVGIPFRHLVSVIQMAAGDFPQAEKILERGGYRAADREALQERLGQAQQWLERFAPEEEKFSIRETLPPEAAGLDAAQRNVLRLLADRLEKGMTGESIHQLIYEVREAAGMESPKQIFQAIYLAILGQPSGPRAGWFLAFLEIAFVKKRFLKAAAGSGAD